MCKKGEKTGCLVWRAAHSIYFEVLGEQGFPGLFIFLAIGLVTFRNGTWVLRKARNREDLKWATDLARMLQVSLVAYAVGGAFLSLGYFDLYFGLVVIMALTRLEVAKVLAEPQTARDKASVDVLSDVALPAPREGLPRY